MTSRFLFCFMKNFMIIFFKFWSYFQNYNYKFFVKENDFKEQDLKELKKGIERGYYPPDTTLEDYIKFFIKKY